MKKIISTIFFIASTPTIAGSMCDSLIVKTNSSRFDLNQSFCVSGIVEDVVSTGVLVKEENNTPITCSIVTINRNNERLYFLIQKDACFAPRLNKKLIVQSTPENPFQQKGVLKISEHDYGTGQPAFVHLK